MASSSPLQVFGYIVIAGYFVILVGTSFFFSKRMTFSADFFTAGGNIPVWPAWRFPDPAVLQRLLRSAPTL